MRDDGVGSAVRRWSVGDLGAAPEGPGLYAWYGVLSVGQADWEAEVVDGEDLGQRRSRDVLRRHTKRHAPGPLDLRARTGFAVSWQGRLDEASHEDLVALLGSWDSAAPGDAVAPDAAGTAEVATAVPAPALRETLADPGSRALLLRTLAQLGPVFAAPLYMGVAANLRIRLGQHRKLLQLLWERKVKDPQGFAAMERSDTVGTFAYRAVRQGFSPSHLEVWTYEMESTETPAPAEGAGIHRVAAEACEYMLNRWHRPPLGRR